jgi:hypothetical protein
MLTRDRRPDFRTMDRWTIGLLLEAGATINATCTAGRRPGPFLMTGRGAAAGP